MDTPRRKNKSHIVWTAEHDTALRRLADAASEVKKADTTASRRQLRSAVDAARDVGVGWTKIGDTLGIASGNAYHRYRKRADQQRCDANGAQG
ncbi:hypothetical protein ASD37_08175 [Mycobacterium sp. Root135]|uniref:hypothetical protein n=1 Tax=Mycobacterium sp. Root135 TaxID=1736457 RepID=UPI0006F4A9E0|nr:hypothetical protein [Mycobacterium sp. Root135]KQY07943.1 hypothetical protein ASD37_08175 [Mycobacterium sp. Root135]